LFLDCVRVWVRVRVSFWTALGFGLGLGLVLVLFVVVHCMNANTDIYVASFINC